MGCGTASQLHAGLWKIHLCQRSHRHPGQAVVCTKRPFGRHDALIIATWPPDIREKAQTCQYFGLYGAKRPDIAPFELPTEEPPAISPVIFTVAEPTIPHRDSPLQPSLRLRRYNLLTTHMMITKKSSPLASAITM